MTLSQAPPKHAPTLAVTDELKFRRRIKAVNAGKGALQLHYAAYATAHFAKADWMIREITGDDIPALFVLCPQTRESAMSVRE